MMTALLATFLATQLAVTLPPSPHPPKDLDAEVAEVIAEWTGDYVSSAGEPLRRAVVRQIAAPAIASRVLFVEVSDDTKGQHIVFQRLIAFNDDPRRLRNWAASLYFADPAAHSRLDLRPAEADKLAMTDLLSFDPRPGACAINVFPEDGDFILTAHKEECRVESRIHPGFVFHPEFRLTVGKGKFGFFEHGFFENGEPAAAPLSYWLDKVHS